MGRCGQGGSTAGLRCRQGEGRLRLQVHDSLASAPPDNVRMVAKADNGASDSHDRRGRWGNPWRRSPCSSFPHGTPTCSADVAAAGSPLGAEKISVSGAGGAGGAGSAGATGGMSGTRHAAESPDLSRGWAGRRSFLDYFLLRALRALCHPQRSTMCQRTAARLIRQRDLSTACGDRRCGKAGGHAVKPRLRRRHAATLCTSSPSFARCLSAG